MKKRQTARHRRERRRARLRRHTRIWAMPFTSSALVFALKDAYQNATIQTLTYEIKSP